LQERAYLAVNAVPYISFPLVVRKVWKKGFRKYITSDGAVAELKPSEEKWPFVPPVLVVLLSLALLVTHLSAVNAGAFLFASVLGVAYGELSLLPHMVEKKYFPVFVSAAVGVVFFIAYKLLGSATGFFFYGAVSFYMLDLVYRFMKDGYYDVYREGKKVSGYIVIEINP
jgi:hypothetical protein